MDRIREQDGDWQKKDDYTENSGVYVPLRNRDADSRLKALLAKLVKVIKKRNISYEVVGGLHNYSIITSRSLVQKKSDPGAFTITCTIGTSRFSKALCDLGASINLIFLAVFKQLGLKPPKPVMMQLLMVYRIVKKPIGISFDVLVKVDNFIFLADFVVINYEVDFEMPIILGRLFLATSRVLVDMKRAELKFRLSNTKVTFNVHRTMKQPTGMRLVLVINYIDDHGRQSYGYLDEL
ncbi:uncharacterized protein LOC107846320 [Capsicum annuum]|uniref:uncharacterized protein LOC107846320 n=1 Tax=Capsicum annuum TaxID=4072 RepID=UPI001FB14782|nr:uncharacterized protein LOC107846320 [Capsicum annuum]